MAEDSTSKSGDTGAEKAATIGIDQELGVLRNQIDAIDRELLDGLNRRAEFVQRVGEIKEGGRKGPIYVAARERDLVQALIESNSGPFPDAGFRTSFVKSFPRRDLSRSAFASRSLAPKALSAIRLRVVSSDPRSISCRLRICAMYSP